MRTRVVVLFACGWLAAVGASAWFVEGHRRVAIDAVGLLRASLPEFFREGAEVVGEGALDPDVWKAPAAPNLRDREAPEHVFDWEELEGREPPELRSQYVRLMAERRRDPAAVGFLPYRVLEDMERLALAFAEHRRWPEKPEIHSKVLLYAGLLAHYAADLVQPLHTTIHHDGRARPDGSSPHTGIHQEVDALFETVPFDREAAVVGLEVGALADPRRALLEVLAQSRGRVEEVYALEPLLASPPRGRPWPAAVTAFTGERYRAAVEWVASLYLTAWERSSTIELPRWLERSPG